LAVALSMPSYEGRLSGPARAAGYEIQRQCRDLGSNLLGDSDSLNAAVQAYESIDDQTVREIRLNLELLSSARPSEIKGIDVGTSYLGYCDDGLSDILTICMYGTCVKIARKGNEKAIEEFKNKVNDFEEARKTRDKAWEMSLILYATASSVILAGAGTLGVVSVLGVGIAIANYCQSGKTMKNSAKDMSDATYGAAYYWNLLTGGNLTGVDDVPHPNSDYDPVYDPVS
jgi:hypothetical protein